MAEWTCWWRTENKVILLPEFSFCSSEKQECCIAGGSHLRGCGVAAEPGEILATPRLMENPKLAAFSKEAEGMKTKHAIFSAAEGA